MRALLSLLICLIIVLQTNGFGIRRLFRLDRRGPIMPLVAELSNSTEVNNNSSSTSNSKTPLLPIDLNSISLDLNSSSIESFDVNSLPSSSNSNRSKMGVAKTMRLGFYFFLWYFFTVVYNISNKRVLNELPLPATLAAVQVILGIPVFLPAWLIKRPSFESVKTILPALSKIGFMHALGNLATVVSLHWGAVSFTHIIKAAEPAFSAVLSALLLGSYFPLSVYLTLIPIIGGVAMASVKELSFTWLGFLAGMASNLFYQLRIVLSKREFSGDVNTLSPANFFRVLTIISSMELLPISLALEGYKIRSTWRAAVESGVDMDSLVANILISGFSFYCYNEVAFWILGSIHPITHAVGNTIKRVVIIMAAIAILKSPINFYGVVGSTIAVMGTLAYSIAQHFADVPKKSSKPLPGARQAIANV